AVDFDRDLAVQWTSSRDGALGAGATVSAVLTEGAHTLTAAVTDSDGATSSAAVTLTVTPTPPVVTIATPAPGTRVFVGTSLTFSATALDATDGDVSGAIRWTSDLDGPIGSGASVTTSALRPGTHAVTAAPTTLVFPAVADTYVDGAAPTTAFGASPGLLVSSSPLRQAFLRFAVSGLGDFTVNRAVLRLTVGTASSDGSASGGSVSTMTGGAWSESVTAFASRPVIDGRVRATRGKVAPKQVVDFDVTGAVVDEDVYDFAVTSTSTDPVRYQSREGLAKPLLVVDLTQNTAPVVRVTAPVPRTKLAPGAALTFAGTALDAQDGNLSARIRWVSSRDGMLGT